MDRTAVGSVESEKQWAQHTALWGARAQCAGGGQVGTKFDCLWSVCEEVLDPRTGERMKSQIRQFADQDVGDDCVKD